jgi:AsmA protein
VVAGVLVAALVVLSLVLDGVLSRSAQAQAAELSTRLGRPVKLSSVSTRFLGGLGATISGVEVGAASGEDVPLAQVQRISVQVAALKALFSLGKDIEVRSVEVASPLVNVVRLPDGTTNVERLVDRLTEEKPGEPPDSTPADLSSVRVDHVAVADGRIRLLDRSAGATRELAISDIDLTADDLRAGRSLEVTLKAAVLTAKQNLSLKLQTAPLPSSLIPTPETVVLHIDPVDIAPLGPFLPRDSRVPCCRDAPRIDTPGGGPYLGLARPGYAVSGSAGRRRRNDAGGPRTVPHGQRR